MGIESEGLSKNVSRLPRKTQEIFADYESVLYVFVRSSLLENQ